MGRLEGSGQGQPGPGIHLNPQNSRDSSGKSHDPVGGRGSRISTLRPADQRGQYFPGASEQRDGIERGRHRRDSGIAANPERWWCTAVSGGSEWCRSIASIRSPSSTPGGSNGVAYPAWWTSAAARWPDSNAPCIQPGRAEVCSPAKCSRPSGRASGRNESPHFSRLEIAVVPPRVGILIPAFRRSPDHGCCHPRIDLIDLGDRPRAGVRPRVWRPMRGLGDPHCRTR